MKKLMVLYSCIYLRQKIVKIKKKAENNTGNTKDIL